MGRTTPARRVPREARTLPACLRHFLTPAAWRQARRGLRRPRKDARWGVHHLVLVLLAMTWSLGDSTPERFAMARGRRGEHSEYLGFILAEMQVLARKHPGATW